MMTELEAIFASDVSLAVFMYGGTAMLIAAMAAVTWVCRVRHGEIRAVAARAGI